LVESPITPVLPYVLLKKMPPAAGDGGAAGDGTRRLLALASLYFHVVHDQSKASLPLWMLGGGARSLMAKGSGLKSGCVGLLGLMAQ
jgi:hypothetical protein